MRCWIVDAFTDQAFRGNPAGVVLTDPAQPVPPASWMQDLAAELKHSETAFVTPRADDDGFDLRWFTPAVEVDLCGHATLASAHALRAGGARGPFRFYTRSGVLTASATGDGITLDFPAKDPQPAPAPRGLAGALGIVPLATYADGTDVLVEVAQASVVADLDPDLLALDTLDCRGVIVTAPADAGADHDFVSRFFGAGIGVGEDPVTGSAHCALGPFWAQRLGRSTLVGVQLSARGGRVGVTVRGDRVELRGQAVTVLTGELLV